MFFRSQPIPKVSDADVQRVVLRDYPADSRPSVLEVLARYGKKECQLEPARVRLAALKLASGDMTALEVHVSMACQEYRDVLSSAEYPAYSRRDYTKKFDWGEKAQIFAADWSQYNTWLNR